MVILILRILSILAFVVSHYSFCVFVAPTCFFREHFVLVLFRENTFIFYLTKEARHHISKLSNRISLNLKIFVKIYNTRIINLKCYDLNISVYFIITLVIRKVGYYLSI